MNFYQDVDDGSDSVFVIQESELYQFLKDLCVEMHIIFQRVSDDILFKVKMIIGTIINSYNN